MKKIIKEIFYTLDEFYSQNEGGNWKHEDSGVMVDELFNSLISNYGYQLSDLAYHGYSSTYVALTNELFKLLRIRHKTDYCFKVDYEPLETEHPLTHSECELMLNGFVNLFNMSMPRYLPLLKAYQENDTSPVQKISSTSDGKTRFNDTPQGDDLTDGYYSDDDHATNVTAAITTTETDPAAIYEQLDKLYENWRSILRDWINEFDGLFIEGVDVI